MILDLFKQIKNTANQVKSIKLNNDQLNNSIKFNFYFRNALDLEPLYRTDYF